MLICSLNPLTFQDSLAVLNIVLTECENLPNGCGDRLLWLLLLTVAFFRPPSMHRSRPVLGPWTCSGKMTLPCAGNSGAQNKGTATRGGSWFAEGCVMFRFIAAGAEDRVPTMLQLLFLPHRKNLHHEMSQVTGERRTDRQCISHPSKRLHSIPGTNIPPLCIRYIHP